MTREETASAIKVMQAYVDGKEIEYRATYGYEPRWDITFEAPWNWADNEYRIKEKSKSFEWRGKNIQWVKIKGPGIRDQICKVVAIDEKGVNPGLVFVEYYNVEGVEFGFIRFCELIEYNSEWSEDNTTWRKFE